MIPATFGGMNMVVQWGGRKPTGWRKDRLKPFKLAFLTLCTLGALWSAGMVAGTQEGFGPSSASAQIASK